MKKLIQIIILIEFIILITFFAIIFRPINTSLNEDIWNNGYCVLDNGRLHYIGTSNKEIYECEKCGKQYKFNGIMSYKGD